MSQRRMGRASGLPNFSGMTTADIAALAQTQAVGDHAVANAFIWAQAKLDARLCVYCEGVHKLIDLHNQTAARMEYNREQAHTATQAILTSILNATVAKEQRTDQDSQGTGSGGHVEAPQPKPCMVDTLPMQLYEGLAAKWGSQENCNSESHMEQEQECSQEHGNY